jgi:hypothetical protein
MLFGYCPALIQIRVLRAMKRFTKAAMAIATVIGFGLITSGTALAATPDTQACTYGSSSGNVKTCIIAFNTVTARATVVDQTRELLTCVQAPSGILLACSNNNHYVWVTPGNSISATYPSSGHAPVATYCADTWRMNSNGTSVMIGQICRSN